MLQRVFCWHDMLQKEKKQSTGKLSWVMIKKKRFPAQERNGLSLDIR